MTYKLFLDDERVPVTDDWVVVRSYKDFVMTLTYKGTPYEVAFDHDLGTERTGLDCANFLVNQALNGLGFPSIVSVHSQNPVGRDAILGLIENFKQKGDYYEIQPPSTVSVPLAEQFSSSC